METVADLLLIIEARLAEMGMTQSQLEAKAFGKPGNTAIQSMKKGSDPAFTRVAAMAKALGLELYLGLPRVAGLEEPPGSTDFHHVNNGRAGYLPIPWLEPRVGLGSAPLSIQVGWLEKHALIPDNLAAVIPDVSRVDGIGPDKVVALIDRSAPRRGTGAVWCIKDAGKIVIARLAFIPGGFVVMPPRVDQAPHVAFAADQGSPLILGRVACLAVVQPS